MLILPRGLLFAVRSLLHDGLLPCYPLLTYAYIVTRYSFPTHNPMPRIALLLLLCHLTLPLWGQGSPSWQQRVHYEMDITLQADRHLMQGFQRLTYTNHSPDTLRYVFYHLYFNAFQPQSMMAERNRHLPDPDGRVVPRIFDLKPDEIGYHRVQTLTQEGQPIPFEVHDTLLKATLARPLLPGASTVFEMRFNSQVPLQTRRSGRDNREGIDYSMSQWYPKMAAYDERGWHADPYIGREFYGVFGTFDVRITLPSNYKIGATGVLQNPTRIGHGYADVPTPAQDSLTWHFRAENVHDFAWAADPDYIHERIERGGITYHLLYQPAVAQGWSRMKEWVPTIIEHYNERLGRYAWPQFTVAQAGDGGMEYPMINFIVGRGNPLGVTAHEAAHEWFYGMLGSNESDYSWMDEGFTEWTTGKGVEAVTQRPGSHVGEVLGMLFLHNAGVADRLSTPADWFETNTAFSITSYSGGAMVLELLAYVLSEPVRDAFLREYVRRFTFRHPNPYDLEKVAEDVSGLQLDWFFEQFTNTTRRLDYAVERLSSRPGTTGWATTLVLEREDEAVLPLDVRLRLADGTEQWVHIPTSLTEGHKPVPEGWIVADPWYWTSEDYQLDLALPRQAVQAEIDPFGYSPDHNRLNNTARFPVTKAFLKPPTQDWFRYGVGYRPLLAYADDFGPGLGFQARGVYLFGQHQTRLTLTLWPQVLFSGGAEPKRGLLPTDAVFADGIDYALAYTGTVPVLGPQFTLHASARKHLGFLENELRLTKRLGRFAGLNRGPDRRVSVALEHQWNPANRVFLQDGYNAFLRDHLLSARAGFRVTRQQDLIEVVAETGSSLRNLQACSGETGDPQPCPAFFDLRQSALRLTLDARKAWPLGQLTGSAAVRIGVGANNLAFHKRYRLGAASFEDAWRNEAYRSLLALSNDPDVHRHLVLPGTAGPVAYLLGDNDPLEGLRTVGRTPLGTRVVAVSLTLLTPALSNNKWLQPLRFEAFAGTGTTFGASSLGVRRLVLDNLLHDAGLGVRYDVQSLPVFNRWRPQSDVLSGLRLVAKFPLWASDPDLIETGSEAFAFRWLIGLQAR